MVNVAVFVSGGGTNLQALVDARDRGELPSVNLVLVISDNPSAYALKRAEAAGIAAKVIPGRGREFEEKAVEVLTEAGVQVIVLAGFMKILSREFVCRYENRIINIHPSLIPSFCGEGYYGLKVHEAALKYGVKVSGATVHFVNEIPDGGKIIMQKAVDVMADDTPESLQKRIMEQAEWVILPRALEKVCSELKG